MKKLILILIAITFIACKDEKKADSKNNETKEVMLKADDPIVDLDSFLKSNNKPNNVKINVDFGGKFDISEFSIYTDSISYYVFKIDLKDDELDIKNYRIALRLRPYPKDINLLSDDSKKRSIDYDNLYSIVVNKQVDNNNFIVFPVDTKIKDYRSIEALLYDRNVKKYLPGVFDINYDFYTFLSNVDDKEGLKNEASLGRILKLKRILSHYNEKQKGFNLALNVEQSVTEEELSNYKFVVRTYPLDYDKEYLQESSIKNNLDYDSWYLIPKIVKINGQYYLHSYIETTIEEFKKVEFLFYDLNQKRFVGVPIIEENFYLR